MLSRIIQAVEDAQSRRAPIQSVADRVVGYFVPAVLLISLFTLFGWLSHGAPLHRPIMNAVSVMVIACPCALGLATPLAILIGTSHAAARGILIKGGDVIEKAGRVNQVLLDKTGTITEGKPVLSQFAGIGIPDDEALRLALLSSVIPSIPWAGPLLTLPKVWSPYDVRDFAAVPGKGVKGIIDGKPAFIGSRSFVESEGISRHDRCRNDERTSAGCWKRTNGSGATVVYLCP